ncbi:hypothetical protein Scep_013144 [Stephania cephalantha]|uniref:Uncharacterized protein n=1 Tax=Stephania cephalantha TaxID=152367 RepID=A0AAP0PAH3_9MAGN
MAAGDDAVPTSPEHARTRERRLKAGADGEIGREWRDDQTTSRIWCELQRGAMDALMAAWTKRRRVGSTAGGDGRPTDDAAVSVAWWRDRTAVAARRRRGSHVELAQARESDDKQKRARTADWPKNGGDRTTPQLQGIALARTARRRVDGIGALVALARCACDGRRWRGTARRWRRNESTARHWQRRGEWRGATAQWRVVGPINP